jgi:predicted short-subunit dehydrogenase-like oxidoreductase (DUF2520 family)
MINLGLIFYFSRDFNLIFIEKILLSDTKNNSVTLTIVGAGNLAWHLGRAFTDKGIKIDKISNRSAGPAADLALKIGAKFTTDFGVSNSESDFTILAINDSFIEATLVKMNLFNTIILHTSGSTSIDIFKSRVKNYGVFYPLQTFTKNRNIDFSTIPVCIEASDKTTLDLLHNLGSIISNRVQVMNSENRLSLHLAAVMTNNFTNHIMARTFDFLEKSDIDKNLILPLLEETIHKITLIGPKEAQTGPARRNDVEIIGKHLKIIEDDPALKNLYNVISDSIIAYYSTKS